MQSKRCKIIYEDSAIIVIDKPSGMLVIPTPKNEPNTLTSLLNKELDARGIEVNAYPCHRLDRDTSGVIVYAKGKSAQKIIMDEFKKGQVKKMYLAFVQGVVKNEHGTLQGYIYNRNKKRQELATTHYKVLARRKNFTVLEVRPVTGRTNQIRIQFAKIGHPLVGERIYAFRKDFALKFKRTALHAATIEIIHPATNRAMSFSCETPLEMKNFLQNHGCTSSIIERNI